MFLICKFSFLDDVPRLTFYGVYTSQFIHFARVCSRVDDWRFFYRVLTEKLLPPSTQKRERHTHIITNVHNRHEQLTERTALSLIQDISWEKGQHKYTPSKTSLATARSTIISHAGDHHLV